VVLAAVIHALENFIHFTIFCQPIKSIQLPGDKIKASENGKNHNVDKCLLEKVSCRRWTRNNNIITT
jgi:hypothetical protein